MICNFSPSEPLCHNCVLFCTQGRLPYFFFKAVVAFLIVPSRDGVVDGGGGEALLHVIWSVKRRQAVSRGSSKVVISTFETLLLTENIIHS